MLTHCVARLASEFLESLDGPLLPSSAEPTSGAPALTPHSMWSTDAQTNGESGRSGESSALAATGQQTARLFDAALGNSAAGAGSSTQAAPSDSEAGRTGVVSATPASASGAYGPALRHFSTSTKAEKFFLTAADQNDGTRDERLAKVIQAKYDAGLLRPYNPVNGCVLR